MPNPTPLHHQATPEPFLYVNNVHKDVTNVIISSNVTAIEESAFADCIKLSTLEIPSSVKTIRRYAFSRCVSLSTVTIPPSVTAIEECIFEECSSLTTVIIPPNITIIEGGAFYGCQSLYTVSLPPSVTTIEGGAFSCCQSLSTFSLPSKIARIHYDAFNHCSNLKSIELESSLPYIVIEYPDAFRLDSEIINENLGILEYVFMRNGLCPILPKTLLRLGLTNLNDIYHDEFHSIFVNWRVCSKIKTREGRFFLFTAIEKHISWRCGLSAVLQGNGAAIEDKDVVTGLEAFLLAAVGPYSDLETVFKLLQDHPAAINPYVLQHHVTPTKKMRHMDIS